MHKIKLLLAVAFLATMMSTFAVPASAHGNREIAEKVFTVGFLNEPAFTDNINAVDLRVKDHETDKPVLGLEKTLKVEVTYGGKTLQLPLRTRFGVPGAYAADFIPTKAGAYTFRFFGTIDGVSIDEKFTSVVDNFNEVKSAADLQFPEKITPASDLQKMIVDVQSQVAAASDLQKQIQELQSNLASQNTKIGQLESSKIQLQENANSASTFAMGGLAVGTLGLVVGAIGASLAIRARKPAA